MLVFKVISALTSMVARMATRSEFVTCVFVRGPVVLHLVCSVTRLGTLALVTLSLPWLHLVRVRLCIRKLLLAGAGATG